MPGGDRRRGQLRARRAAAVHHAVSRLAAAALAGGTSRHRAAGAQPPAQAHARGPVADQARQDDAPAALGSGARLARAGPGAGASRARGGRTGAGADGHLSWGLRSSAPGPTQTRDAGPDFVEVRNLPSRRVFALHDGDAAARRRQVDAFGRDPLPRAGRQHRLDHGLEQAVRRLLGHHGQAPVAQQHQRPRGVNTEGAHDHPPRAAPGTRACGGGTSMSLVGSKPACSSLSAYPSGWATTRQRPKR